MKTPSKGKTIMGTVKKSLLTLVGLGALVTASGCGEVSYFEVDVTLAGLTPTCAFAIAYCEVTVSGATTDRFDLRNEVCDAKATLSRGKFQYGTEAGSGTVNFHMDVLNGNRVKLGQGDTSGTIKPEGRVPLTMTVNADPAALAATMACAQ
jgi:hypothetical protein